jgi:antirestriction protein ArdC
MQVRDQGVDDSTSTRLIPMMREYTVFNVDQCDSLPDSVITGKPIRVRNPDARDDRDARIPASYLLARPKPLRVLAGLSH